MSQLSSLNIKSIPSAPSPPQEGLTLPTDALGILAPPIDGIQVDMAVECRYEKDGHIYMLGLTSPTPFQGSSVAFVQLASPTLLFIADWTACKMGAQPEIPDPNINDPNWVLLDDHWEPVAPTVPADILNRVYRISGCYVYGHRNPAILTYQNVTFPLKSWMQNSIDRTVPLSKITPNLLTAGVGSSQSVGLSIKG